MHEDCCDRKICRRIFSLLSSHQDVNYLYKVGDAKTVGLEFDWVHLDSHRKFSDALPYAKFVDVSQPTMKMRMIKSPEEIELIKQGARIADLGGEAVVKAIKEGAAEHEIALASTNAMVKEIADTYPHSEIRDSKFQLFILFKFLYSFSFCFLGVFNNKKKCGSHGYPRLNSWT